MNKKIFSLVVLACFISFIQGCGTTPAQVTYKTLAAVGATEDAAMKTAASLKASNSITDAQWATIASAHTKYQAAYTVAVNAAIVAVGATNSGSFPATSDLIALANDVVNLVGALKGK